MRKKKNLADQQQEEISGIAPPIVKRGRKPAPILGKAFEPNVAYIIGRMKKGNEDATQFPVWRTETMKKYYGQQIIDSGANTTHEFFKKNPLDFRCSDPKEFWFIYIDQNGQTVFFDRGQFETIKPPEAQQPQNKIEEDEQFKLPSNPGLGDLVNALITTNKKGGGDVMQQVVIATMQQQLEALKQENTMLRSDYNREHDENVKNKIELERLSLTKQMEMDKAIADAKEAVWTEANAMLDKYKQENAPKGGLSGLFDDPVLLTNTIDKAVMGLGMLMQLPKVYKEIKNVSNGTTEPQQIEQAPQAPQPQYGAVQ